MASETSVDIKRRYGNYCDFINHLIDHSEPTPCCRPAKRNPATTRPALFSADRIHQDILGLILTHAMLCKVCHISVGQRVIPDYIEPRHLNRALSSKALTYCTRPAVAGTHVSKSARLYILYARLRGSSDPERLATLH